MTKAGLHRTASAIVAACCIALLIGEAAAIADIERFEWRPLYSFVGLRGLSFLLVMNAGAVVLLARALRALRGLQASSAWPGTGLLVVCAVLALWALEWMFIEAPPTHRLQLRLSEPRALEMPPAASGDLASFSLSAPVVDPAARERLAVMYERIRLVNPETNRAHPIGRTIDRYANRYEVDPTILFYVAYVHSFWGEAASGRVPFLGAMTSETIRDIVQIHLPSWFIEARLRRYLIDGDLLERMAGDSLGFKLRYALHKATLDVSAQPYELNMFSDVLLVLSEYPQEFQDVLGPAVDDPVRIALRDAYRRIGGHALEAPYEEPYATPPKDRDYYDRHRRDLKRFARAAYYATALDFDLATRIAALLVDYQKRQYVAALDQDAWAALPDFQQAAMLVMTRDVYVPNVGRLAYNLYALPEMNCTPVAFVADQAKDDPALSTATTGKVWRPREYTLLWGGAATKLRVLSEVWGVTHGAPLPGLEPENSIPQARRVVLLQQTP